jgi:anti-sigma factor RsiW
MTHRYLEDRILLYIDGDLPPEEQARCEEHLRTCPRCSERVKALRAAWDSDALLSAPGPTLRLRTRFEAALRGEAPVKPGPTAVSNLDWLVRPALMAATLAVGILIGAYLGSGPNGETARVETPPTESNVLAFTLAEDLQEITTESVGQDYLLLDWDESLDDPAR